MQPTVRKTNEKVKTREKLKDETGATKKLLEEKDSKKQVPSTPRNFMQKSSAADIYAQKIKNVSSSRAPKKLASSTSKTNISPMKDLLKSTSSVSVKSAQSTYESSLKKAMKNQIEKPSLLSSRSLKTPRTGKDLPFANVTVNSPIPKRRLNLEQTPRSQSKEDKAKSLDSSKVQATNTKEAHARSFNLDRGDSKEVQKQPVPRQRTKTRTLDDDEVIVLKPEVIENRTELKKMAAKPKSFYINLDGDKPGKKDAVPSDEEAEQEISYEDDFESYESDFESYHSEESAKSSEQTELSDTDENQDGGYRKDGGKVDIEEGKEAKDEEKMLDSGSYDLREAQRSANRKPATLEFILEGPENDSKLSLPDEGFQEMASLKTVDILDRPLFINFTKSKEKKRKKKMADHLKQRAEDLLSMITLHEMSYTLFEMKPIPYDLYMATFGRSNYIQIAVQTFDDGITEEVQTDEILYDEKWTQHPVEFSKHEAYLENGCGKKKSVNNIEDELSKFTFLVKEQDPKSNEDVNTNNEYKNNPLRVYFEQKDGSGSNSMLPYEKYKTKLENKDYNVGTLRKFLKKVENRVSNILNLNSGVENIAKVNKSTRLSFSKGYLSVTSDKSINTQVHLTQKHSITDILFSDTKSNLIMTVHGISSLSVAGEKCIICLWDISVARKEPLKILMAIDNVAIARFRGGTDGIFVAALEYGSIHLWDLSEEPNYRDSICGEDKPDWQEVTTEKTGTQKEWVLNSSDLHECTLPRALHACAFTASGANITANNMNMKKGCTNITAGTERVVGLELIVQSKDKHHVGQIIALQRTGVLEIWAIIQEKHPTQDIGKAFWSKIKLELFQKIFLIDYIDAPTNSITENEILFNFNLNAAKRRLSNRKSEKKSLKSRANSAASASSSKFESDRPISASKVLPVSIKVPQTWESGIVCYDLRITHVNRTDVYLVAKNCGEVLCCTRNAAAVKINTICVASDKCSVSCLDTSPQGFPYFLAGTESGTVNLCSLEHHRVLLTLDCRNVPLPSTVDHCHSDNKGRYVSSSTVRPAVQDDYKNKLKVTSIHWSQANPCCVHTLADRSAMLWDLTDSDISARGVGVHAALKARHTGDLLALLTPEGEVQVHRTAASVSSQNNEHYKELFLRYVSLL